MEPKLAGAGALIGILVLASSCTRTPEREPELRPASGGYLNTDRALAKLAVTNCDRELACGNIGAGRRYETRALCLGTFEREKYEELGFRECLLGVDYQRLDACSRAIESAECRSPLDTLEPYQACAKERLCRD
jgi:hypothetical protein